MLRTLKKMSIKKRWNDNSDLKESLEAERSGIVRDVTSDYEQTEEMEM